MAITSNTYTGNGSNKLFSITFPYLETTDVDVYLNSTLQTITTQYTFANATTIEFVAAPANGAVVLLDRSTDDAALQATFFPGSSIKAADLNADFDQTLYVVQEINNKAVKINDPLYANKTYIDAADALKVNKSGDTMSGALAMGTNKITGLGNPTAAQDAVTKTYVDAADALKVNKAGDTMSGNLAMGGNKVTGLGTPSANADAATKQYADSLLFNTTGIADGDKGDITVSGNGTVWTIDSGLPASRSSFTQSGTGATVRTVDSKLKDVVSVKDFGAVGNGVANDTAAIQAAIDSISALGGELLLPPGTYKITNTLTKTFSNGLNIAIRGYGAKIDATSITTGNAIELGGSRATSTPLGSNVSKNSDTFTVTSASGITAGRVLLITSTDLWNPTRAYYYKGELSLVDSIVGTTITNSNPLYDNYTASTTTVHLLNMPQITVEGIEIVCNADVTALQILYGRNIVVRNCNIHGSRYAGVYVGYCLGATIDSNFIYDVWNGLVTGNSYGISVGTGQGVKVVNNTIYNARHAISGGGFEPLREVIYANNTCHNSTLENQVGCIDLHGNIESAVVQGNIATSISLAAIDCIISNNILKNAETDVPGILIFQEINSNYYNINNNQISCAGTTSFGIWVGPAVAGVNIQKLVINSNIIESLFSSVYIQPRASTITGCSIDNIILRDNYLKTTGAQSAFTFVNNGAATYLATNLFSSGNIYKAVNYDAFSTTGNSIVLTNSVGDTFQANRLNGSVARFCGTDVRLTSPLFYGNTGGAGNSRSVSYVNTGRVDVFNPVFANMDFKAEFTTVTEYVENGWYSATPTINGTSARLINSYGAFGRAVAYDTAAPSTKTWSVGDRVFNQTPAAGLPKSWVCTVAGTPGTWVSEGNL